MSGLFGALPIQVKRDEDAEAREHALPTGTIIGPPPIIPEGLKVFCGELIGFRALGPMRPDAGLIQANGKVWVSFTFEAGPSVWRSQGKPDPTMGEVPGSGARFEEPETGEGDEAA